jgi:septal ring factor EnvC (AmiA/AmiB activator)
MIYEWKFMNVQNKIFDSMLLASLRVVNFWAWKKENMETNQKQHTKELKSLKLKMDDVKFANSKMTKELAKSEKANSNLEFEIKQLKKKLENHQKTKEKSPKECVETIKSCYF